MKTNFEFSKLFLVSFRPLSLDLVPLSLESPNTQRVNESESTELGRTYS